MSQFLCLQVSLVGLKTPVWRRFALRADASLLDLHQAIRDFGWIGLAGWELTTKEGRFLAGHDPEHDLRPGLETKSALNQVLKQAGDEINYVYDLEDRFEHRVLCEGRIVGPSNSRRSLFAGLGSFPPEGCGGPEGFERILHQLKSEEGTQAQDLRSLLEPWSLDSFNLEGLRETWDRDLASPREQEVERIQDSLDAGMAEFLVSQWTSRDFNFQEIMTEVAQSIPSSAATEFFWSIIGMLSARDDLSLVLTPQEDGGLNFEIRDAQDDLRALWQPASTDGPTFRIPSPPLGASPWNTGPALEPLKANGLTWTSCTRGDREIEIRMGQEPAVGSAAKILSLLSELSRHRIALETA